MDDGSSGRQLKPLPSFATLKLLLSSAVTPYLFHFDDPIEALAFQSAFVVEGWLLHRDGKPINGIRAAVDRPLRRRRISRARRKRSRSDVAAAYPDLADPGSSGFYLETQLSLGPNTIEFQVLDHDREWRTFHSAKVTLLPVSVIGRVGFPRTEETIVARLRPASPKAVESAPLRSTIAHVGTQPLAIKNVRLFATSKSNLFITEIGQLLAAGFRESGCDTTFHIDQLPDKNPPPDTLQIVVTPHEFYNLFVSEIVSPEEAQAITRNVVLLCTEQPETPWFHSNLRWTSHALAVADIHPLGVAAYRARYLPCHQLALGYHDLLAHAKLPPHAERDLDITFLGSLTPRRDEFFAQHALFFSEHECHLRLVPIGFAKTKTTTSYLTDAKRNELLSRSRILLNVHYSEQKYFEWHRMLVALANGCCIITETCQGHGRLVPGEHFIMVEPEQLIPCCEYYLHHPDECARIAAAGAALVRTQLRQADLCGAFLRELSTDQTTPSFRQIEADAPSRALPTDVLPPLPTPVSHPFREALAADLRVLASKFRKVSEPQRAQPSAEVSTPAPLQTSELRNAVVRKREGYRKRWLEQRAARAGGDAFVTIHDGARFRGDDVPALSVLITLYNYEQFIEECIVSVEAAAAELEGSVEVLIVDDGSTDRSLARALHCQKQSPLSIRVVEKKWNTGLADARNVGVELARADYVFMLDADNLLYPNALQRLFAVIRKGDHDAAYGLLCRFRGTPANRVGLLSYFDWDPEILVQYPYIDAMAMFRRSALLGGRGYNNDLSQIGWFGWEDYDLWLRFALNERSVAFVPNILCLYRHHGISMINTTNLFELELGRHFVQNYGSLLEQYPTRERVFGLDRQRLLESENASPRGGNAG